MKKSELEKVLKKRILAGSLFTLISAGVIGGIWVYQQRHQPKGYEYYLKQIDEQRERQKVPLIETQNPQLVYDWLSNPNNNIKEAVKKNPALRVIPNVFNSSPLLPGMDPLAQLNESTVKTIKKQLEQIEELKLMANKIEALKKNNNAKTNEKLLELQKIYEVKNKSISQQMQEQLNQLLLALMWENWSQINQQEQQIAEQVKLLREKFPKRMQYVKGDSEGVWGLGLMNQSSQAFYNLKFVFDPQLNVWVLMGDYEGLIKKYPNKAWDFVKVKTPLLMDYKNKANQVVFSVASTHYVQVWLPKWFYIQEQEIFTSIVNKDKKIKLDPLVQKQLMQVIEGTKLQSPNQENTGIGKTTEASTAGFEKVDPQVLAWLSLAEQMNLGVIKTKNGINPWLALK